MPSFSPIYYLRWARSRELDPETDISLILSGMQSPPADWLEAVPSSLQFDHRDLPALGRRMAEDLGCAPEEFWLQPGTHGLLFDLLAARLATRPGPVLVEEPAYEPLRRIPAYLGTPVLRLPRPRGLDYGFDWDALDAAGAQRPSVLLLSQPHNPSGAVLDADERAQLREWATAHDCAILSDEVYLEFLDDPRRHSLRHQAPEVMAVGSFTKVMGLGGLRISWAQGPADWLRRATDFSDYATLAVSAPSQALGAAAWEIREKLWQRGRDAAAAGRAIVAAWLERHEGELDALLPDAGIITFPRVSSQLHGQLQRSVSGSTETEPYGYGLDDRPGGSHEWIRALAREERVHLTPGAFFEDPMAFRLGFGIPAERLEVGLARLDGFIERAKEIA